MTRDFDWEKRFGLADQTAFVTGAAGQLGSAIVTALLEARMNVVAVDHETGGLRARADEMGWSSGNALLLTADIRERGEVESSFSKATDAYGPIHHLVNNAGVSVFEPFLDRPEESLDWVMDVNLKGTVFCTVEYLTRKRDHPEIKGSIVNIASHYGLISPDPRIYTDCDRKNSEIYGATKAGIIQMTRYYAVHAAEFGVRVNTVSPGGIRNPENPQGEDFQANYGFRCPLGRMAETDEIVGPVMFLMSRLADYVTGHNVVVDGGMSSW